MNEIHLFLQESYMKTQWPYFSQMGLQIAFGPTTVTQLNELRTKGVIKRREGANGSLVELIKTD